MRIFLIALSFLFIYGCNSSSDQAEKISKGREETPEKSSSTASTSRKVILFFGNSLTAGYGVDPEDRFTAIIQDKIDSLDLPYEVINAGVSGETTASGNSRLDWVIKQQDLEIFVLELGANDGLRGIPTEETRKNLATMIDKVREKDSKTDILLTGMMVPPNMGPDYSESFTRIFPEVASEKNVSLMPFLLKDVAGEPDLNLEDGIHPNKKGHKIVANNLWPYLRPLLDNPNL
jgi:acyl-CoA thioesterase-1